MLPSFPIIKFFVLLLLSILIYSSCDVKGEQNNNASISHIGEGMQEQELILAGAESLGKYVPLLKDKNVGLVVNHTSRVGDLHLLDTLLSLEVDIEKIFTPEHGFSGQADAGEKVQDTTLPSSRIPVLSLYGKKKKPETEDLFGIDYILFDIQDVGVRFYTYISTLHYVMEACAEAGIPLIVLDRPNPNGHYVDGPVLEEKYRSFVGMHPIPVVYGMTIGELAQMINGEGWLKGGISCDLTVIKNSNYTHLKHYEPSYPPSPNLKDLLAISLYPSLCFFEATPISVGRGTKSPFTLVGHPKYKQLNFAFTPQPNEGSSNPKLKGERCYGYDFSGLSLDNFRAKEKIELKWLIEFYENWNGEEPFFKTNGWMDKLAGTESLRKKIESGESAEEIRAGWQEDLEKFKLRRKEYLLYPDFE